MQLVQFTRKLPDVKHELIVYVWFTRMSPEHFEQFFTLNGLFIAKKPCWLRNSIERLERFSIAFTANVRLKFPIYQKLVKFIWFQLIFCLLATAMEQVLKTEK